jgi:hypothetical protein
MPPTHITQKVDASRVQVAQKAIAVPAGWVRVSQKVDGVSTPIAQKPVSGWTEVDQK